MADPKPTIIVHGFDVSYKPEIDPDTKKPTGKMREIVWVRYSPMGMSQMTVNKERLSFLDPANMKLRGDDHQDSLKMEFLTHRWEFIRRAYEAWRDGHEITVDGTPLAAWSGLNPAQAEIFRNTGLKTVELIAQMTEATMSRIGLPDVRHIRDQARAFLASIEGSATAERFAAIEMQNTTLNEDVAALRADLKSALDQNRELMAMLQAHTEPKAGDDEDQPTPRGRRRQQVPAEAA